MKAPPASLYCWCVRKGRGGAGRGGAGGAGVEGSQWRGYVGVGMRWGGVKAKSEASRELEEERGTGSCCMYFRTHNPTRRSRASRR